TYVDGQSATLNGTQPFNLQYAISSSQCPMTIVSANVSTPGFQMNSVVPDLPFTLPPNSNAQFQFNMRAPATDFYGPLTISIHYN
ncbi:MAG: hypothetical protein KGH64_04570, partial [Candidatus Micrarchaeota archaeon]|nr:hypothetical protein [Candidatus Micrarchaeota archaeon]